MIRRILRGAVHRWFGQEILAQSLDINYVARRIDPQRKHLWQVAAPKTGSTWLTSMLIQLFGWETTCLIGAGGRREQEVDLSRLLLYPDRDIFSVQQHCRFSEFTRDVIEKFKVRVILQGRNIFDCVVSCRDHLLKESLSVPMAYVDEAFLKLPGEQQLDFVCDLVMPWYFNFYLSWFAGRQRGEVDFHWVDYESLLRDPRDVLRRIVDYVGEKRTETELDLALKAVEGKSTRQNEGRTGRGLEILSEKQIYGIRRLREFYPHIDLSPIGL